MAESKFGALVVGPLLRAARRITAVVLPERLYKLKPARNKYKLSVKKLQLQRQKDKTKISELENRLETLRVKHELGNRYAKVFQNARIPQNSRPGSIRVFRADCMEYTPFRDCEPIHEVFAAAGMKFVDTPAEADIILARREEALEPYGCYHANFVIWTHEPRHNNRVETPITIPGIRNPVHIMNCYTGQIYVDNFYFFPGCEIDYDCMMEKFARKPRRAVALATYRPPPTDVWLDGRNIDLHQSRQQLALRLLEYEFCDVYGRNWPKNIKIAGESRKGPWWEAKKDVLSHYKINICFENTIIPHYVTEKLWDAIVSACLPVYHGSDNRIYETFPRNSFIEASGKLTDELASEVINMSLDEMEARYAACLQAYLNAYKQDGWKLSHGACLDRILCLFRSILSHS